MTYELTAKRLRHSLPHQRCSRAVHCALGLLLIASSPTAGSAEKMQWQGTLQVDLGNHAPMAFAGSGVATLKGSGAGPRLENLRIAGGITGAETIPITDPDTTGTYRSLRISPRLGTGTLGPFWPVTPWPKPQLSQNAIPVQGSLRICMFFPGCSTGSIIALSRNSGSEAVGVGGTLTEGGFGDLRISIEAAPWTVYSTQLLVDTARGGTATVTRSGWIHGPASYSSSAATPSGALQLVSPLVVRSSSGMYLPGFTSLTIRFVPEPKPHLLVATGIIGLCVLHKKRHRRSSEVRDDAGSRRSR